MVPDPAFDSADYELRWPRELFARELDAVRAARGSVGRTWIEALLEEAFLGTLPVEEFRDRQSIGLGWEHLNELRDRVPQLREHRAPRPYWSVRRGAPAGAPARSMDQLRAEFVRLIHSLRADGYFGRDLPKVCVDDRDGVEVDPNKVLFERLGVPDLWPLEPDEWDDDVFYDLVEVFHDLAARPRTRRYHDYGGCGWDFGGFAADIGRALYRWRLNELLATGDLQLRLADAGEDIGRLVQVVDDARTDLVERVLRTSAPVAGAVDHAIALFRGRAATEHEKRSAIVALANVLEDRRKLLKENLFSDDEGALFQIANKFDLRHRNEKQHADYDPAFRDWVFWWYLATIELTDRLLARQGAAAAGT